MLNSLQKAGVITLGEDSSVTSVNYDAENFVKGMATYRAGTMGDESKLTIGGVTVDLDRDLFTGDVRMNTDSSQVDTSGIGKNFKDGLSGNIKQATLARNANLNTAHPFTNEDGSEKDAVEFAKSTLLAATTIEAFTWGKNALEGKTTPIKDANGKVIGQRAKRGVFTEAGGRARSFFASSSNSNILHDETNNKKHTSTNGKTDNPIQHDKSPSIHSLMTNSNIKTPQAQTFLGNMMQKVSNSKVGKRSALMFGAIGVGATASNASDGSGDFVPLPNQGTLPQGELVSPKDESLLSDSNVDTAMTTAALGFNAFTAKGGMAEHAMVKAVGMKTAMKTGGKLIPGIGFALGTTMAADEFEKGNYGRAALEMLSGVASLVPSVGTMVQVKHSHKLCRHQHLNKQLQWLLRSMHPLKTEYKQLTCL